MSGADKKPTNKRIWIVMDIMPDKSVVVAGVQYKPQSRIALFLKKIVALRDRFGSEGK